MIGSFHEKYVMLGLKKCRGVIFHGMALESDAKFEKKLTCGLENNEEFGRFLTEHLNVGTQNWDFYRVLLYELKIHREFCVMTLKKNV